MGNISKYVHELLVKKRLTLSIAESCTGGMLASSLTEHPGSSRYLTLGIVAYSNRAKKDILGIPESVIAKNGAVSKRVAELMSLGAIKISGSKIGVGITGVAGPSGATLKKPKGTVFIAVAKGKKVLCKKFSLKRNRKKIRTQSVLKALGLLKFILTPL